MQNLASTLQNPQLSMEKVEDELFKNSFRDNFDMSLESALKICCIDTSQKPTEHEQRIMQMYMQGELDYDQIEALVTRFNENGEGEKIVCRMLCYGNMAEFNELRSMLKAIKEDLERAKNGESNRHVSQDVGKLLQDHEKGDHAPSHSLHLNNGLGDNAGYVSRFKLGYVWRLFADGYIRECKPDMAKELMFDRYDIVISEMKSIQLAEFLTKERRLHESKMLQGDIGDSPVVKDAISIITNEGKKKGLSYEKTDRMGRNARRTCEKFEHDAGKIIGKAVTEGKTPELEQKTARFCKNFIEGNNLNADNVVELLLRMFRRKSM